MSNNESDSWSERFRKAQDLNELLATARRKMQEENGTGFPIEDEEVAEDAAMDFAWSTFCNWMLFFGPAQIEGQQQIQQIDDAMDSFVGMLRKMQALFPRDEEELKKEVLHGLKRQLIGPHHPLN